jgi:hypothetical protein
MELLSPAVILLHNLNRVEQEYLKYLPNDIAFALLLHNADVARSTYYDAVHCARTRVREESTDADLKRAIVEDARRSRLAPPPTHICRLQLGRPVPKFCQSTQILEVWGEWMPYLCTKSE